MTVAQPPASGKEGPSNPENSEVPESRPHSSSEQNEEEDEYELRITRSGCRAEHEAVQDCFFDCGKDWRNVLRRDRRGRPDARFAQTLSSLNHADFREATGDRDGVSRPLTRATLGGSAGISRPLTRATLGGSASIILGLHSAFACLGTEAEACLRMSSRANWL
ncbi:MAG: hypothetical protein BJ554DRAFT_3898 [Olpidium bornovanus]|uniref:Uncharacterized protein n=1 Tax=Olpidium bornovanus TaxID=278681 RepID=A0A8H7ZNS7_9FUNG|nr:MAG: hypothetical protein BJ554DRAFT_3898 [Olpidium bornovanus]